MNDIDDIGLVVQGNTEPYTSKLSSLLGYAPQMVGNWISGSDFDLEGCMLIVLLVPSFLHQVNLECCVRPPSKSPSHFRLWSLGDKTLSSGEYCHVSGCDDVGINGRKWKYCDFNIELI